jgi:hypothetical protein
MVVAETMEEHNRSDSELGSVGPGYCTMYRRHHVEEESQGLLSGAQESGHRPRYKVFSRGTFRIALCYADLTVVYFRRRMHYGGIISRQVLNVTMSPN